MVLKKTKKTKARSELVETCYSWEQVWIDPESGERHYDPYKECFINIEVRSDFHTSRGGWNINRRRTHNSNRLYNGGTGTGKGRLPLIPKALPEILPTQEFKKAKTGCVYDRLMLETSFMKDLLKKFVPVNSRLDLKLEVGYIPLKDGKRVNGRTYSTGSTSNPDDDAILIKINEQILDESPLKLASTIAHELIHAEIFRSIAEGKISGLKQFKESYPQLWSDFVKVGKKYTLDQHEHMTKNYVEDLTELLQWFDRGRHSKAEYNAMAWMGLDETSAFKNTQNKAAIKALQTKISNEGGDCDDI